MPLEVALDAQQLALGRLGCRDPHPAAGGSSLTQRLLGAPPALLCATPAYLQQRGAPERPDDLRSHDLLTPDAAELPEFRLYLSRGAQRAEVPLTPKLAVDDPAVLHAATAAGLGIGLLPEFLCRQGLATGRLKCVLPELGGAAGRRALRRVPGGAGVRPARAAVRRLPGGEHRAGAGAAREPCRGCPGGGGRRALRGVPPFYIPGIEPPEGYRRVGFRPTGYTSAPLPAPRRRCAAARSREEPIMYRAPLREMRFVLEELLGSGRLGASAHLPGLLR